MVLSKPMIEAALNAREVDERLVITPKPEPHQIGPCSIDLRLDKNFRRLRKFEGGSITVDDCKQLWIDRDNWHEYRQDTFELKPQEFVIGWTHETVRIPLDMMALVEGRSNFARAGLSVHMTAPKIDPGFNEQIVLEIFNHGSNTIRLRAIEDMPCQLILFLLNRELDEEDGYKKNRHPR